MACCAVAIYLVSLVLWPLRRLLRFGRAPIWQADAAVDWVPGGPRSPPAPSILHRTARTAVLAMAGLATLAGSMALAAPRQSTAVLDGIIQAAMCGDGSLRP